MPCKQFTKISLEFFVRMRCIENIPVPLTFFPLICLKSDLNISKDFVPSFLF